MGFDRTDSLERLHFASAMTLLGRGDGEPASYLDVADFIIRQGSHPQRDLEQLWPCIVFFMCVSNIDDHLRNHGFLLEAKGWSLAPAFAKLFRLKPKQANDIITEGASVVSSWRAVAKTAGLSRADHERMASAFEVTTRASA